MHRSNWFAGQRSCNVRASWAVILAAMVVPLVGQAVPAAAAPTAASAGAPAVAYTLDLPAGQTATVFSNGVAAIFSKDRRKAEFRTYPVTPGYDEVAPNAGLPGKGQ